MSASNGFGEEYEAPARTSAACLPNVLIRGEDVGVLEAITLGVETPSDTSTFSTGSALSGEAFINIPIALRVARGLAPRTDRDGDPRSPSSKSSGSKGFVEENEDSENSSAPLRCSVLRRGEGVGVDVATVGVPGRGTDEGLPTSILGL